MYTYKMCMHIGDGGIVNPAVQVQRFGLKRMWSFKCKCKYKKSWEWVLVKVLEFGLKFDLVWF